MLTTLSRSLPHRAPPFRALGRPCIFQLQRRRWTSFALDDASGSLTIDLKTRTNTTVTPAPVPTTFPYIWLRDSCQSSTSIHPTTSQKLHRTSDVPLDIRPRPGGVLLLSQADDDGAGDRLTIDWTDGHRSSFSREFLERHASAENLRAWHADELFQPISWDRLALSKLPALFTDYTSLSSSTSSTGLLTAITQLTQYGLLFVRNVPRDRTSDAECELRRLVEKFGEIRETFYGRTWDVRNVRQSRNVAYTNLDLGLHMDLLYFHHPPRYQILHCLRNKVRGGTSIFVDAFHAAHTLRTSHPEHFDILTKTPVPFHYVNDGHHLHYEHPTIELASSTHASVRTPGTSGTSGVSTTGGSHDGSDRPGAEMVAHINFSPPFQAPLLLLSTSRTFYPALQEFTRLLYSPLNTYEYLLQEGDAVVFDNRRVLHARTAFVDDLSMVGGSEGGSGDGETNRWLKGCYFEGDAMWDRARVLSKSIRS